MERLDADSLSVLVEQHVDVTDLPALAATSSRLRDACDEDLSGRTVEVRAARAQAAALLKESLTTAHR
jgi:hypothetical protein